MALYCAVRDAQGSGTSLKTHLLHEALKHPEPLAPLATVGPSVAFDVAEEDEVRVHPNPLIDHVIYDSAMEFQQVGSFAVPNMQFASILFCIAQNSSENR